MMEPWDGPAAVSFTDGTLVGATLDRNGLRPARYWITDDGLVVLASEVGVLEIAPEKIVKKGRVAPGKMFLVDTDNGRLIRDEEVKAQLAAANPWAEWAKENTIRLADLPEREHVVHTSASVVHRQRTFGYTTEELKILLGPMAKTGAEPLGAMGTDTPVAVLSKRPRLLFDYFVQSFAQVTNPPLDAIREELVTSLNTTIGPQGNLLSRAKVKAMPQVALTFPVINNDELAKIANIESPSADGRRRAHRHEGARPVQVRRRCGRPALPPRRNLRAGFRRHQPRRAVRCALRPRLLGRVGAHPVPAAAQRRAPPPAAQCQPHQDLPGGGGRRRPRGPPRGGAGRLRRRRSEPVPGHGIRRGADPQRRRHRRHPRSRAWPTSSRAWARAF